VRAHFEDGGAPGGGGGAAACPGADGAAAGGQPGYMPVRGATQQTDQKNLFAVSFCCCGLPLTFFNWRSQYLA